MSVRQNSQLISNVIPLHSVNETSATHRDLRDSQPIFNCHHVGKPLRPRSAGSAELQRRGFQLYERFRPDEPLGEPGWGAMGELEMTKVRGAGE